MSYPPPPTLSDELAELKFLRTMVYVLITLAAIGWLMSDTTDNPSTQPNANTQESQP